MIQLETPVTLVQQKLTKQTNIKTFKFTNLGYILLFDHLFVKDR